VLVKEKKQSIQQVVDQVNAAIAGHNWHMPMPSPVIVVSMIEAKAKLMEGIRKLEQIKDGLDNYKD